MLITVKDACTLQDNALAVRVSDQKVQLLTAARRDSTWN